MDDAKADTKKTPEYSQSRSVSAHNGTSRSTLDKHRSGSSHSHGRPSSQFAPRKINTASRTSGIADPYDLSAENEVLNLGLESERRTSRREERALGADPEMTFRPEHYETSATCPPFLRGKKGFALLTLTLLVVVGTLVGAIVGTKKASQPRHLATSSAPIANQSSAVSTDVLTDTLTDILTDVLTDTRTLTVEDIITPSPLPTSG